MALIKASEARTKTLQAIERQKEIERERTRKVAEQEAEARRLQESQRIQRSLSTKQKQSLLRTCVLAAAKGDFYILTDNLAEEVCSYLSEKKLAVSTVGKDLEILRQGLFDAWGFTKGSVDYDAKILEPLYRQVMICIIEAWRSRDNNKEEIKRIASIILRQSQEDHDKKDLFSLHEKFKRLKHVLNDSHRSCMTISDLFHTRADHHSALEVLDDEVFEIVMSPNRERELSEIVDSIFIDLEVDVRLQGVEDRLLMEADGLSSELIKSLCLHDLATCTVSWWHAYLIRCENPESLAQELWWLSADHGQLFLHQLEERIESATDDGKNTLTVTAYEGYGEVAMVPILRKYLEYMGYEVETNELENKSFSIKISW